MTSRVWTIARREFRSTVLTPAFALGLLGMPVIMLLMIVGTTALSAVTPAPVPIAGTVAIIDETVGRTIAPALEEWFSDDAQANRAKQRAAQLAQGIGQLGGSAVADAAAGALEQTEPPLARVELERLVSDDEQGARQRVIAGELAALLMVPAGTVVHEVDEAGERVQRPVVSIVRRADARSEHVDELRSAIRRAVIDARTREAGFDPDEVRAIDRSVRTSDTVAQVQGDREGAGFMAELLPLAFAMLILITSTTGGNYLLMGTLEEKGSRAMEVLLSAAGPMQIMCGKLVGQGAVGLLMLCVYSGAGLFAAAATGVFADVPPLAIGMLVIYFVLAYAFVGALMLAVGSVVTEIREAQALFPPVTASIVLPMLMVAPAMQNPDALIVRVLSHIPPGTPFVMAARLSDPAHTVPLWELATTTLVQAGAVALAVWFAARVFRVGVLMYGQAPNLVTMCKLALTR